ncbi:MAG: T9SS type A sorting domain-containing protein [Bacteroidota bacterium]|nr:T9SS type A sorting domain-containing protein [Bacteroidota bacterium]
MKKILLLLFFIASLGIQVSSQVRYLDEMFTNVTVDTTLTYGVNATILYVPFVGQAVPERLLFDIYTPDGDANRNRPLILYYHTGNFLPFPQNGGTSGTRRDSTVVEICTRLAKMGYVVASVDYRLGWDPTNTSKDIRVFTLINAAYRGVQDAKTCIRYFKRSVVENANPFGIDTGRITIWGQGTGGYVVLNTSALDDYNKIPTASDGKFLISVPPIILPMVLEGVNGNLEGTSFGIVPSELAPLLRLPAGDTLCYPNHIGYNSDFQFGVNMGGAIGDSAWLDRGHVPLVSMHSLNDAFAPCAEGLVLVPVTPPLEVVKVQGSCIIQAMNEEFGNNNIFSLQAKLFNDPYSIAARKFNGGLEGFFPLSLTSPFDSSPWDYWSPNNPNHARGLQTNPTMSKERASRYIDTLIGFVAPRACLALGLNCDLSRYTGVTNVDPASVGLQISPNPAIDGIHVSTSVDFPIISAQLLDINGKKLRSFENIHNNSLDIQREGLISGFYLVRLSFEKGESFVKVIFK